MLGSLLPADVTIEEFEYLPLISNYPALILVIDKLIVLLNSGATIPEIAATIAEFAASPGLSTQALLDLLCMVGGALMLF